MLVPFLHRLIRRRMLHRGVLSREVSLRTARLHYYEIAPPDPSDTIVLIHGLGTSASTWVHVMPVLGRQFRVIAPDLPLFGFSRPHDGFEFRSIEDYAATLSEFLNLTAPTRFILVGHSFGGWIAMRYAVQNPGRISRLILINTAGIYYEGTKRQRELFDLKSPQDTTRLLSHLWLRYPWYFRPFTRWVFKDLVSRNVPSFVRAITREDFMNSELSRISMPLSIIWGIDDRVISAETISVLKKAHPSIQSYTIDNCGHVPQLERPRELLTTLEKILGRQSQVTT